MMSAACPVTESSTFSVELRRVIERVEKLDFERWFVKKCAGKTGYYITPPLATKRSALVLCLSFFQAMCNFSDGTLLIECGAGSKPLKYVQCLDYPPIFVSGLGYSGKREGI